LCLFKKKKTQKSKKCVNFLRKIKSNLANELKLTSRIKLFVNFKRIKLKMKKKIVIQPNFELNQFYWVEPRRIRFDSFPAMCLVIPLVLHPKVESLQLRRGEKNRQLRYLNSLIPHSTNYNWLLRFRYWYWIGNALLIYVLYVLFSEVI
jgi:hypothetical protein